MNFNGKISDFQWKNRAFPIVDFSFTDSFSCFPFFRFVFRKMDSAGGVTSIGITFEVGVCFGLQNNIKN